ncbi:hypothetical protein [uncultured Lentibacter sp.]|mgnify:CR=1 FL=1|jgi:hypothetical protein|uniref:hypothetical protein n=1 Tax=uncultured Lentibacter sp. TaxID=1659309 RepID=UPI0026199F6F|nr:hypothetical protein [uncultured Lentibacter sp.]
MTLTPDEIETLFCDSAERFDFARWARPIAPIVFGVEEETIAVFKGALEALSALTRHPLAETDPELGANVMIFVMRDWAELIDVPDLHHLVPELHDLVPRLEARGANRYRLFRFEPDGGLKAGFAFLRLDTALAEMPADSLALTEAVQLFLKWGAGAFAEHSPLARLPGGADVVRPEIGDLLRAAYAPELPNASRDSALALRLFARMTPKA